ncbi:AMP-binding protein [Amycolatopsis sp. PS_44_ISF1]|uniref:AMP-binding protein n=1 Tax=Amycolatopsis sp. PS_44_ISF1 TaxID=2974917 RepID=UPI0028E01E9C|nr:AMP-binding protein [Amycolatopsis sp. PS_44_ISF1]MDT8916012.1 AMP-binding protein [Amycolatopsis sp. PS_44_ISF1]
MLATSVRAHAESHPGRVAVVAGGERVTYAALERRIARWREALSAADLEKGALVGIHLGRGVDAVAAPLAVLGMGAAYTVVEPSDPVAEGVGRLAVACPDLVLTSPRYLDTIRAAGLAAVTEGAVGGDFPIVEVAPGDIAYVLYTSGSTGVPKGVMVTHGNIAHYTESLRARLGITEPLAYAHVTTLAADLGNTSLFLALWTGGTLHVVGDERRDPDGMLRYLAAERVDFVKTTPSHWGAVFRAFGGEVAPRLRFLLLGGELLPHGLARAVLTSGVAGTLVNHYGPTETTVGVAAHILTDTTQVDVLGTASVPIGTPIGGTRLLVRLDDGTLSDRDAAGELLVAGPSVTAGYRADEGATAAVFTDEPGVGRVYRTGDRVRVDHDGVLEFLGRGDRQVKIGGYRIELGHVESRLRELPGVVDAVVLYRTGDRPALLAAVFGHGITDPRAALRDCLPRYMIPERVEILEEFPRNGNGKVNLAALRSLLDRRGTDAIHREPESCDPLLAEVLAVWRRHLGHGDFGAHDDFLDIGGTSIDAIGVIADLQARGYEMSAAAFLAAPTAAALVTRLRSGAAEPRRLRSELPSDDKAFSPAQEWFFRQDFAQPGHWNQALLLDVDPDVRSADLATAVDHVVAVHPLLHTAFRDCRRERVRPPASFTVSRFTEDAETHLLTVAADRQAEIDIGSGVVFKGHLALGPGRAHLLLVCHHLCVDVVSWRVIVNDISCRYSELLHGEPPRIPAATPDFGTWATVLHSRSEDLRADLAHWDGLAEESATPAGDNVEGEAQAVWFGLCRAETEALSQGGLSPAAALLGAFAQASAELDDVDHLVVDVESHGRESFGDTVEISRTVGWFTATFPIRIEVAGTEGAVTVKDAAAALDDVPHLGVAYSLHDLPRRSDVCFNYLGTLTLPYGDDLRPVFSRLPVSAARGAANDRVYGLKLTARIQGGQLVTDLSYTPRRHRPEHVLALARATRAHLQRLGGHPVTEGQYVVEPGSTTGLLGYRPPDLQPEHTTRATRDYRSLLLTGATGFIGAHLLHLLLTRTDAHVHCLVRGGARDAGHARLRAAYTWAVPGGELGRYADRITVHTGDLTAPTFGLAEPVYDALCHEVEAIYHLAADTRLFGDHGTFARTNTEPVRALIQLATTCRVKDLHHVSTLAVCGDGGEGRAAVFFEDCLDIGQRFLNEYERCKFDAERLVARFAARGGTAFIYRSGDVTGHSATGRFQRNAEDNRLVQMLRAAVALGRVPAIGDRTLALSPVDTVAEGILAISRDATVSGGTFHVDTPHTLVYRDVFAVLRDLGHDLAEGPARDFAELLAPHVGGHHDLGLAYFWANRPERNVRYNHTRTHRLLAELGVVFPELDRVWLRRFLAGLTDRNRLGPTGNDGE